MTITRDRVLYDQDGDGALIQHVSNQSDEPGHDDEYDVVQYAQEVETGVLRTADGLQVTGPCLICGYVVHVATATAEIEVEDGLTAAAGGDKLLIPRGAAIGVYHFGGLGIKCATGAYLNYQASATGSVSLLVRLAAGSVLAAT